MLVPASPSLDGARALEFDPSRENLYLLQSHLWRKTHRAPHVPPDGVLSDVWSPPACFVGTLFAKKVLPDGILRAIVTVQSSPCMGVGSETSLVLIDPSTGHVVDVIAEPDAVGAGDLDVDSAGALSSTEPNGAVQDQGVFRSEPSGATTKLFQLPGAFGLHRDRENDVLWIASNPPSTQAANFTAPLGGGPLLYATVDGPIQQSTRGLECEPFTGLPVAALLSPGLVAGIEPTGQWVEARRVPAATDIETR